MEYKIINYSEKIILKDIIKIPKSKLDNIFLKIEELGENGLTGNIHTKKLKNYYLCDYRLRIGDYRVLFNIDEINKEIIIFRILHRSKLY